jgi:myo-inositol-1(or 4)-monophosphatase
VAERFPGHVVLGEEQKEVGDIRDAEFLWAVDPVDGTANFVNGLPIFCCSIGLLHRLRPVVGCIFLPTGPDLRSGVMHARSGGGAFFGDSPVRVRDNDARSRSALACLPSSYHVQYRFSSHQTRRWHDIRSLGSIAYEMALAACGVLEYAAFRMPRIWDVAAGLTIVKEAGGETRSWDKESRCWFQFERFQSPGGQLRRWTAPLLVGGIDGVRTAGAVMSPERPFLVRVAGAARKISACCSKGRVLEEGTVDPYGCQTDTHR